MSLRFIDGFDHYATANITEKWTATSGAPTISAGNGRRGGQSGRLTALSQYFSKTLDNQATWIIGFAFRAAGATATVMLSLLDAGTAQCDLRFNADGTLSVTRNGTAVTGGTSSNAMSTNTYYYVEWKVTIADSIAANSCKVRVNGVDWLTVTTGQDVKSTANATANMIRLGPNSGSTTYDFDDLYICDGNDSLITGVPNNDFLGDVAVQCLYPSGAGASTVWTPDSGSNYARVNEALADGDTSYVETGAAGNIDSYTYGNLAGSPAKIFGVGWCPEARKTDASTYMIRSVFNDGIDHVSGVDQSLGSTYAMYQEILQAKPGGSSAWAAADLASGPKFGMKLNSVV